MGVEIVCNRDEFCHAVYGTAEAIGIFPTDRQISCQSVIKAARPQCV